MTTSDIDTILRRLDLIDKRIEKVEFAVCKVADWQRSRDQRDHDHALQVAERLRIIRATVWLARQGWVRYPAAVGTAVALQRWVA